MTDSTLPAPPIAADTDCRDLDGFMLHVERLMASELVAISSHEVVAAALYLWCRAWKQIPAASLPDDDAILAGFAQLSLRRFQKFKTAIIRGFVKCSDGRLYHTVIAAEAKKAFEKKKAFQNKRERDTERLRKWRESRAETEAATAKSRHETCDETRFVAEGQGQGQGQGESKKESKKDSEANASAPVSIIDQSKVFWDRAKSVMAAYGVPQARVGPLVGRWRRDYGDSAVEAALMAVERDAPSEVVSFVVGCLNRWKDSQNGRNLSAANQRFLDGRAATLRAAIERDPSLAAGFAWPDSG